MVQTTLTATPPRAFVSLVGAGPGDPELLTLRALHALQQADAVLYDALVNPALLHHCPHAQQIKVGKRGFQTSASQDDINQLIVHKALENGGQRVVRLKGGDPFIFGRGGEELLACHAARIPHEVIPGISSAVAGPAYAGIPVTHRGTARSFAVLTGTDKHGHATYQNLHGIDTLVFLMALHNLAQVCADLIHAGRPASTPVATVQSATLPDQRVVTGTLATIADIVQQAGIQAPALTIVGEVANLREQLHWFTPPAQTLTGLKVVLARTRPTPSTFAATLRQHGAEVTELPLVQYAPPSSRKTLIGALKDHTGWVALTTEYAVKALFDALHAEQLDARFLARVKIAAVGSGTAQALKQHGLHADFVPTRSGAKHLGAQLPAQTGELVLHLGTQYPETALQDALTARGIHYHSVETHRSEPVKPQAHQLQALENAHAIILPSANAASTFAQVAGTTWNVTVLGPQTQQAALHAGLNPTHLTREATLEALLHTLQDLNKLRLNSEHAVLHWQTETTAQTCEQAS